MNFLAPLFLAGAAAVALPILFHLIRRTTRDRFLFSSLRFLDPSPPRMNRRSRLENLLLLLLRCAALLLLAAGFARPFLRGDAPPPPNPTQSRRVVLLVDTSASMRRPGLWDAAQNQAATLLRRAGPGDEFAVVTFARTSNTRFSFEEWNRAPASERAALATARLQESSPGWSATHLGDALIAAAESLEDSNDTPFTGRKEIILISDLQEGGRLDRVQGFDWPRDISVTVQTVRPDTPGNAGIQIVGDPHGHVASTSAVVRVRVSNAADSLKEQFTVAWAAPGSDSPVGPVHEVYVPPGQSRTVSLPAPTNSAPDRVILRGDDQAFDNVVHVFPPEPLRLPLVYLGNDDGSDSKQPLFFLRRALVPTPAMTVDWTVATPSTMPPEATLSAAALVIITGTLEANAADTILRAVRDGRTALFAPRNVNDLATLARWLDVPDLQATEVRPSNFALLGELDFRHPLLAAFSDPRFSDFTRIHFWKYRRLAADALPGARVIARFDSGDPAWLEVPVGKGRLLVLTSGWHPEDSQLALSTKFVPLLFSIIETGGTVLRPASSVQWVDSPLSLQESPGQEIRVRPPEGETVVIPANGTAFTATQAPGVYEITVGTRTYRTAINLDPAESLTAPRNPDDLERAGAPVASLDPATRPSPARAAQLAAAEAENRQKLWRWFLAATLLVLLTETAVAGWSVRKRTPAGEVAA